MPPRGESSPSRRHSSELSPAERTELLDILTPHVDSAVEEFERSPIADQLKPYGILVGLMGVLRAQNPEEGELEGIILQHSEILHLRKMIGFEAQIARKYGGPVDGMDEFWNMVKTEAGREVTIAKRYMANKPQIPPRYKSAKDDLGKLKMTVNELADERERCSTGWLMESLKQSVQLMKADRKSKK